MWMRGVLLEFLILASVCLCATPNAQRYCGRKLADTLEALCDGVYNTWQGSNNAAQRTSLESAPTSHSQIQMPLTSSSSSALSRRKRGVYEECCLKECTVADLMKYCGVRTPEN